MLDVLMLALGAASFALLAGYLVLCERGSTMSLDLVLFALTFAGLTGYLLVALLRPEKF